MDGGKGGGRSSTCYVGLVSCRCVNLGPLSIYERFEILASPSLSPTGVLIFGTDIWVRNACRALSVTIEPVSRPRNWNSAVWTVPLGVSIPSFLMAVVGGSCGSLSRSPWVVDLTCDDKCGTALPRNKDELAVDVNTALTKASY